MYISNYLGDIIVIVKSLADLVSTCSFINHFCIIDVVFWPFSQLIQPQRADFANTQQFLGNSLVLITKIETFFIF